ncbi:MULTISPECIES: AEC family transporter [Pseudomonas]|jgi:predicted permease|uniref:AEC family transporter n=1 Tax=Pseudomonas coleopterorum TaxID=1605838 RepID=A0ABR9BUF0_9PSED|nr:MULTISPECIES: AEC family transporter [Pseudomonas]KNC14357.1 malate transporter [Pseudomonas sp. RIT-PI-a]KQQ57464.1 malate transporter [Pseudomonas sp. Leaf129]MBD8483413.1 AEC family transporter [Pseudomonas coleopterorum]MBD8754931.1 AEC family transporter [Pseudomonas coleopterorum]MBD8768073.1 AEC family transporter [Pseudomonas coleopterorum]
MLALFLQTLNVTAPVFAMLFLGYGLKRIEWINDNFIKTASALVFNVCMPSLLFLGIYHADLRSALKPGLLVYFVVATVGSFAIAWWIATKRCPEVDRGVFTQGAFRGNNGVIGLALAGSMYGDYGISLGSILAGLVIVLYNSLSVVVLAIYSPNIKSDPLSICKSILVNPLIISVVTAVPFAWLQVPIPNWILTSADYVAQMSLPLALICIGGTLSLAALRSSGSVALSASAVKMILLPIVGTFGAWLLGFRGAELGILFLYIGAPSASVGYVMVRASGGNYSLAAAIIVITTLAAAITTNIGIFLLQWGGWI